METKKEKKGINVLSLFDGMSCGRIALQRAGITYDKYFASEIDKYAISVTQKNYPNTIQLGDVKNLRYEDGVLYNNNVVDNNYMIDFQLLIGGSPCQSFSFAGKRKGMATKDNIEILSLEQYLKLKEAGFEFEGQSYLFWEYVRILKEVRPKYFFLENVRMEQKWKDLISETLGVQPILINSSKVSAQSRERYYWTNIPNIQQPEEKGIVIKDILEPVVDEKFYGSEALLGRLVRHKNKIVRDNFENPEKSACIHAGYFKGGGRDQQYIVEKPILVGRVSHHQGDRVIDINGKAYALTASGGNNGGGGSSLFSMTNEEGEIIRLRKFTPLECERLQTIPDNYTALGIDEKGNEVKISNTQRYRMVGNSWTCSVISHIFKNII